MTNAEEKAQAFGIKIPPGVPPEATVLPPQTQSPTGENIQFATVRALASQVEDTNRRKYQGYKAMIDSYHVYGIDPPYPPPPVPLIQYYEAAKNDGTTVDSAAWAMGVPQNYEFPQDLYFWIWDK